MTHKTLTRRRLAQGGALPVQSGMIRTAILFLMGVVACSPRAPGAASSAPTDSTAQIAAPAPASIMGAIVGANVAWGDYHSRDDAGRIAALYTDDAVLMTAPGHDVVGRGAIREYFQHLFATRPDSILATNSVTETVDVAGDRAYEAGTVTFTLRAKRGGTTPRTQVVRYITFWQKAPDGRWLIRRSLRLY